MVLKTQGALVEGKGQKWKMSWTQLPTSLCPNSLRLKNAWIWGQLPLGQFNRTTRTLSLFLQ